MILELIEPAVDELQLSLDMPIRPDAVARRLVLDVEAIATGERPVGASKTRIDAVRKLLRTTGRIGPHTSFRHRDSSSGVMTEAHFSLDDDGVPLPELADDLVIEQRVIFGHVYMADVESGRQRLRVKLPSDRDITMEVNPDLVESLPTALDQLVELHVSEASRGGRLVERVVGSFRLIEPSERGPIRPEYSAHELAALQGLRLQGPPDYRQLLGDIFPTESDAATFRDSIARRRTG